MLDAKGAFWLPGASWFDMAYDHMEARVNPRVFNFVTQMVGGLIISLMFAFMVAFAFGTLAVVGVGILWVSTIVFFAIVVTLDTRCRHRRQQEWTALTRLSVWVLLSPTIRRNRKLLWEHREEIEQFFATYSFNSIEWGIAGEHSREYELQMRGEIYAEARRIVTEVLGYSGEEFDERLEGIKSELPRHELQRVGDEMNIQRSILNAHENGVTAATDRLGRLGRAQAAIAS